MTIQNNIISVSELNRIARELLETAIPPVWISGEISNLTLAASGHAYFSLKDVRAQIRAVMFRNRLSQLGFRPKEGLRVEVRGTVSLYEARGDYQINVSQMQEAGLGALYAAFEALKTRLAAEGLFDNQLKRPLPAHPKVIGIVTSPQAAALRDVLTTLRRRAPQIPVVLYPTQVQGDTAPAQIVAAIGAASRRQDADVLIVCRGGGSIEDLWAFNDEQVARAIRACRLPVISGVGHETDFTIADFAADVRAPTPTAAAELVSPDRDALLARLAELDFRLGRAMHHRLDRASQQLDRLALRLTHPGERIARQRERLAQAEYRLHQHWARRQELARLQVVHLQTRLLRARPSQERQQALLASNRQQLARAISTQLERQHHRLAALSARLDALDPQAVLARGYAIVENARGQAVLDPAALAQNERVTLRLALGNTGARIDRPPQQGELPV